VLLADDHRIVLEGLRSLLGNEFELVGEAGNGQELIERAKELRPDVAVVDVSMPVLNGIDAVQKMRAEGDDTKVIFLTMHPDSVYANRAMAAGAAGYVLKHAASEELVGAIRIVLADGIYVSPQVKVSTTARQGDDGRRGARARVDLTTRQREVLQLIAEGRSAREIGEVLGISARTVETHKYRMMDELGLGTTAELVQHAVRLGLVQAHREG
jgi:DNA-binding NarL/FixJ family response regulator